MTRWVGIATVALAVVLLVGCGGGSGGGAMTTATTEPGLGHPGELVGGKVLVEIKDLKMDPEELTVPAGATVVWLNADNVSHSVKKVSGPRPDFDSGPIDPGGSFSQVFENEGTYEIEDDERPTTKMTLEVSEDTIEQEAK